MKRSQEKDPRTFEGRSHQVERWRVQEKCKEEKWKRKKKKKTVKYRKVKWWKKCEGLIMSLSLMGMKKGQKEEGKKGERCPEARPVLGEVWKVAPSLYDCGPELARRERGSRRTIEKDGGGEEDTAGSTGKIMKVGEGRRRW